MLLATPYHQKILQTCNISPFFVVVEIDQGFQMFHKKNTYCPDKSRFFNVLIFQFMRQHFRGHS